MTTCPACHNLQLLLSSLLGSLGLLWFRSDVLSGATLHLTAGVFPRDVSDVDDMARARCYWENIRERNKRLVKLYHFYGAHANGKPWPAEEDLPAGQHQAVEEFITRAGYLKTFLRLE